VSLATASRVVNGGTRKVRADLSARVMASAVELGYMPNPHARALASATSDTVGLVVHDVRDPYFAAIAGGAIEVADSAGLLVAMVCTYRNATQETKYVSMLRAQRVRAIILTGSAYQDRAATRAMATELDAHIEAGGAVVSVTRHRLPGDAVLIKNRAGAAALARSMTALGHERFAAIAGPQRLLTVGERLAGFRDGLRESGHELSPDIVFRGDFSRDGGYDATMQFLATDHRATCLFAASDTMALGALAALRKAGIDVPGQISVTGFGGIPSANDSVPELSTLQLPLDSIGAMTMQLALDQTPGAKPRRVSFAGEVVLRGSTAPPRSAPRRSAPRRAPMAPGRDGRRSHLGGQAR
jgi:LacI family transcriptional regulator